MDLIRGENAYEDVKRKLYVPLCVGVPGLGKTRFARIAVTSLVQKATGISSPTLQQMLESSQKVAQGIWPDDTCMAGNELLRELIIASHEDKNIRIMLNCTPGTVARDVELEIIVELLVQWMKHRKLRLAYEHLINDRIVNELQGEFGKLRDICPRDDIHLTFSDTVEYILQQSSITGEAKRRPPLIINLDEAQKIGITLQNALEILLRPILVENCRVFITITGISKSSLYAAIEQSAVSVQTIILSVLTDNHMCSILVDLFGPKFDKLP